MVTISSVAQENDSTAILLDDDDPVLAAIDKYAYAKSIDSEVAEDANSKIARYSAYKPEKQDGFMRGVSEGSSITVNCWIGETVRVRFK